MSKIAILGAGGRAGRRLVAEAAKRGHEVTAFVRDPAKHSFGVPARAADVTKPLDLSAYDVAISTVGDMTADATEFYTAASRTLLASGVPRVIVVGISVLLDDTVHSPEFPAEHKPFCLGHLAGLEVLRASTGPDWVWIAPVGDFDHDGEPVGGYRFGGERYVPDERITYEDFALAVLDEAETPKHHRQVVSVLST
ncbi:NAD(P)-dependent oxidoreductase [Amycolatopsis sp. NPDC059657]|uniref:NAD(P)-dependent oxidoreductase n=1 Tax=Amycolatopsis sp. NPDC059657 TaxID=3346899 RepID=UPI00366F2857